MLFTVTEKQAIESARKIKLLLLDVDGILTDGRLYFSNSGEEIVSKRASDLGIEILYQGREDKIDVLQEISAKQGYTLDSICYAGDDLPDLPVLNAVGLSFSVPGAHESVQEAVHGITTRGGGAGAVREITDFILSSKAL